MLHHSAIVDRPLSVLRAFAVKKLCVLLRSSASFYEKAFGVKGNVVPVVLIAGPFFYSHSIIAAVDGGWCKLLSVHLRAANSATTS